MGLFHVFYTVKMVPNHATNASHIVGLITIINKSNTNTLKPSSKRSSRPEVFYKISVLKSFPKLTENTCARVFFPGNSAKLLRTPFLKNTPRRMFLT